MGASEIIVRFAGRASEIVDGIQTIVNPIFIFSQGYLFHNALLLNYVERITTAKKENNLLQEQLGGKEENEQNEEEEEWIDHPLTTSTSTFIPVICTNMVTENHLEEVEATPHEEPPPKPPEPIVDKAVVLETAPTRMDEGELEGKTISELAAMYFSKSNTSSYSAQTVDNLSEEALCLANDFGNINELKEEPCYESGDTNMIHETPLEKDEVPSQEEDEHEEELMIFEDMQLMDMYEQVDHCSGNLFKWMEQYSDKPKGNYDYECIPLFDKFLSSNAHIDGNNVELLEYSL